MRTFRTHFLPIAMITCSAPSWSVAQKPVIPVRVADLNPNGASNPDDLTTTGTGNSLVYFTTRIPRIDQAPIYRMYATNGTAAGTQVVEEATYELDILSGTSAAIAYTVPEYSSPDKRELVLQNHATGARQRYNSGKIIYMNSDGARFIGDKFYMGATAGAVNEVGAEPYIFSSATSAMTLLKDITATSGYGSYPQGFTALGNKILFNAMSETYGSELWVTDGTAAGTVIVKDLLTGASGSGPSDLLTVGSSSYFVAENVAGNRELWITNGTTAGTTKLKEINPSSTVGSAPRDFTANGGKVFFTADNGTNGRELWVSNGTAAGTTMVKDIHPTASSEPHDLMVYNGLVWFFATDGTLRMSHLYSSDGTAAGTTKRISVASGSEGNQLTVCNGKLFYVTTSTTTTKLWKTDGTDAGTQQVLPALAGNVNPIAGRRMAVMNNWLYFNADFDASGAELWKVQ